jgi:hypothetical protein
MSPIASSSCLRTGARTALGARDISKANGERLAMIVTAGLALWNIGIAVLVGVIVHYATSRRRIRL